MRENLKNEINELKGKKIKAIIDEGRARKREEIGTIKGAYDKVFTIETNDLVLSFSYSDLICKTIIIEKI